MPVDREEFLREAREFLREEFLRNAKKFLFQDSTVEERLEGLTPEQRLAGLTLEDRETLRRLLDNLPPG
jgi:hypothetical protein